MAWWCWRMQGITCLVYSVYAVSHLFLCTSLQLYIPAAVYDDRVLYRYLSCTIQPNHVHLYYFYLPTNLSILSRVYILRVSAI